MSVNIKTLACAVCDRALLIFLKPFEDMFVMSAVLATLAPHYRIVDVLVLTHVDFFYIG